jgi:hypothetical protein
MTEKWRAIYGYTGRYEVSNLGRVRSLDRRSTDRLGRSYRLRGKILRPGRTKSGHYTVALCKNANPLSQYVHILVAKAFLGPRPEGLIVSHGRAGCADNRLSNLSYATSSQNNGLDRWRDGTMQNARPVRRSDGIVYTSMTQAATRNGIYPSHIHNAIHGTRHAETAGGFRWEYIDA